MPQMFCSISVVCPPASCTYSEQWNQLWSTAINILTVEPVHHLNCINSAWSVVQKALQLVHNLQNLFLNTRKRRARRCKIKLRVYSMTITISFKRNNPLGIKVLWALPNPVRHSVSFLTKEPNGKDDSHLWIHLFLIRSSSDQSSLHAPSQEVEMGRWLEEMVFCLFHWPYYSMKLCPISEQ